MNIYFPCKILVVFVFEFSSFSRCFNPHGILKAVIVVSVRPSVLLHVSPKPFDEIQFNLVCDLFTPLLKACNS